MTSREKKQRFLKCYQDNARELTRLEAELALWEGRSARVPAAAVGVALGGLRQTLCHQIAEAAVVRLQLQTALNSVEDAGLRLLLHYHYVDGMTIEAMAERMHYSVRQMARRHVAALEQVRVEAS